MNVVGKISLGLAAAGALHLVARAESPAQTPGARRATAMTAPATSPDDSTPAAASDSPYATIVARNIFGLLPVPPPPPPPTPPVDPPPKITANGIMNVFGELEALFKVSFPAQGSTPAKDQSYMLSQGQRQDDIEVTKIDEPNATITFDNHGTVQEIPLSPADKKAGSGGPSSPITSGAPQPGGFNPGGPGRFRNPAGGGGGFTGIGGPGAFPSPGQNNNPGLGQNNNNPSPAGGIGGASGVGDAPNIAQQAAQDTAGLTPEQQAVLIEGERLASEDQIKNGSIPMPPPTPLTPPDATGPTGEPIIQSPEPPAKP